MTFPYTIRNSTDVVFDQTLAIALASGSAANTQALNIPPGYKLQALSIQGVANNKNVAIKVRPYINRLQSIVDGSAAALCSLGGTSGATVITINSTNTTRGTQVAVGAATTGVFQTGLVSVYGFQLTATFTDTGATGNCYITAVATK